MQCWRERASWASHRGAAAKEVEECREVRPIEPVARQVEDPQGGTGGALQERARNELGGAARCAQVEHLELGGVVECLGERGRTARADLVVGQPERLERRARVPARAQRREQRLRALGTGAPVAQVEEAQPVPERLHELADGCDTTVAQLVAAQVEVGEWQCMRSGARRQGFTECLGGEAAARVWKHPREMHNSQGLGGARALAESTDCVADGSV